MNQQHIDFFEIQIEISIEGVKIKTYMYIKVTIQIFSNFDISKGFTFFPKKLGKSILGTQLL